MEAEGRGVADMDFGLFWQDYRLDRLQEGMEELFPGRKLDLGALLRQAASGDLLGALGGLFRGGAEDLAAQAAGMRGVFVWLLVLGIVSALMTYFIEIFDRCQAADLGFYFMYLLFAAVLLKCFYQAAEVAGETVERIILFVKLLIPTYLLAVGASAGAATAGIAYQMMLVAVYGVERFLAGGLLPLLYSYAMLAVMNGLWAEDRLGAMLDLLGKAAGWGLRAALGAVTGIGLFQRLVGPVVDSARNSVLQKLLSAIPGIGGAAGGAVELAVGSAVVIRNSVGAVLLLLLLLLCAVPLCRIMAIAVLLKCAAAFMGIVSDKRITDCVNRIGDAAFLLLRAAGTAALLFVATIAAAAV